jgi:hypothetical protein
LQGADDLADTPEIPAPDATATTQDRGSVLRFLDKLYGEIGRAAFGQSVPNALQRSLVAAAKADADHRAAATALNNAEAVKRQASAGSELVQASSAVAQARTQADQTRTQADFACLVLGRECVMCEFVSPGMQERVNIALRLRAARGSTG